MLPAAVLGYFSLAYISRMTRSFMLNELGQEYIVAVRAKGLSERKIVWGHALRNAAVPLVTALPRSGRVTPLGVLPAWSATLTRNTLIECACWVLPPRLR